jgi:hypothetical protein
MPLPDKDMVTRSGENQFAIRKKTKITAVQAVGETFPSMDK